ncbi:AraC family transcriptional regulator [Sinomicrobium pectinilyticum]|uniref:AraC family transcriptional regulator n=1 Tax=Sinomicrobium pectinilyticum TaxID=1084421 RepID=A0A3N0E8W8_SINP1|nr:AraC family transcriptional regulator [Sinomicrobium pectinilyticum]RNL84282.1 AraC family transcriptional regulator [Sinomicrobium pectinilyticum]
MNLKLFKIHPVLQPFINRIWFFESSYDMDADDLRMVVPSGNITLIYTLKGDYQTVSQNGLMHSTCSDNFTFIGQQSCALTLKGAEPVTSLGVSFNPTGAYRFFEGHLTDTKGLVLDLEHIFYRETRILKELMFDAHSNEDKVYVLQKFLISKLAPPKIQEPIVEKVTQKIIDSGGLITLAELCEQTNWSKRHLNRTFSEIVGQNIKSWSQTIRFKYIYNLLEKDCKEDKEALKAFYLTFYDQAHFIHSFKKVTGKTPNQFLKSINQFGNYFNRIE